MTWQDYLEFVTEKLIPILIWPKYTVPVKVSAHLMGQKCLTLVSLEQHHLKGTNRDALPLENYEWSGFNYCSDSSKNSIFWHVLHLSHFDECLWGPHSRVTERFGLQEEARENPWLHGENMQTGGIWTQDFLPARLQGFKPHYYAVENKNLWNAGFSSFFIVKP